MSFDVLDRIAEVPYRIRSRVPVPATTWALAKREVDRITVHWPRVYQWQGAAPIVSSAKEGLATLGVLHIDSLPQTHKGVVTLQCAVDGHAHAVVYDYSDHPSFINEDALEKSALYFKCQFREEGYTDNRIIPAGYHVMSTVYYKYYSAYRRKYRDNPRINVVARFGYAFQGELRRGAVSMLERERDLGFVGAGGKIRYSRFLQEAASARLCLHLPGNGPFTYRIAEFLGLGTCMVSPRFTTSLHVPLEPDVHYIAIADDLSDLIEKCRYYLSNEEKRERIARAGQEFFDRYLHCDQLAGYYVRCILDRLGTASASPST